jgi:hypothetical protein
VTWVAGVRDRTRTARMARERRTIAAMIGLYCRHHHRARGLCEACAALDTYAARRLDRCVFGSAKPTCANCAVHCYRREMREAVREVMRWSGPRMLLRHPILAVAHMLDGRRPTPTLPRRGAPPRGPRPAPRTDAIRQS